MKKEIYFDSEELLSKIDKTMEVAEFLVDPLQEALIQEYTRQDVNFRRAVNKDYTPEFLNFLVHKATHNEPISISIMGMQRGGKSYAAITLHAIMMLLRGKEPSPNWILADKNEYLGKLKLPSDQVKATTFVMDEDKTAVFGTGSMARKQKLLDIQNIIAVNAISTIWIRPDEFAFSDAQYGLRVFGRFEAKYKNHLEWEDESKKLYKKYLKNGGDMNQEDYEESQRNCQIQVPYQDYKSGKLDFTKFYLVEGERRDKRYMRLTRFMLYNLQESSKTGLPLGMVYLPPFTEMPEYFRDIKAFEKEYMDRKMDWVQQEQESMRDVLYKEKMKYAIQFAEDPKFLQCKSLPDKSLYISVKLGSEMTKADCEEMARLASRISEGFWTKEELEKYKDKEPKNP